MGRNKAQQPQVGVGSPLHPCGKTTMLALALSVLFGLLACYVGNAEGKRKISSCPAKTLFEISGGAVPP